MMQTCASVVPGGSFPSLYSCRSFLASSNVWFPTRPFIGFDIQAKYWNRPTEKVNIYSSIPNNNLLHDNFSHLKTWTGPTYSCQYLYVRSSLLLRFHRIQVYSSECCYCVLCIVWHYQQQTSGRGGSRDQLGWEWQTRMCGGPGVRPECRCQQPVRRVLIRFRIIFKYCHKIAWIC